MTDDHGIHVGYCIVSATWVRFWANPRLRSENLCEGCTFTEQSPNDFKSCPAAKLFYARLQNASRVLVIVWVSVRPSVCLSVTLKKCQQKY